MHTCARLTCGIEVVSTLHAHWKLTQGQELERVKVKQEPLARHSSRTEARGGPHTEGPCRIGTGDVCGKSRVAGYWGKKGMN